MEASPDVQSAAKRGQAAVLLGRLEYLRERQERTLTETSSRLRVETTFDQLAKLERRRTSEMYLKNDEQTDDKFE